MKDEFNIEHHIKEIVNKKEVLPESIKAKTQAAYKEVMSMNIHKKNKNKKKWFIAAGLLVVGAISLQTPLLADIKELFFGGNYKGVETAIEKGNLQSLEGIVSESNGIKLEAIGVLVDPTIIHLRLKLTAYDPDLFKGLTYNQHSSSFMDQFNITDSEGRIIQRIDEEGPYTPPFKDENGKERWFITSSSEQVNTKGADKGEIYIDILLNSAEGNYEGMTGLIIETNQLGKFRGDWTLEIPFSTEMREGKEVIYEMDEPSDKIEVASAIAYQTGLKIDFIVKVPVDENIINSQITGTDGSVYTTGRAGWIENTPEGERVVLTFEVLEEDLGDSFTLHIQTLAGEEEGILFTRAFK